MEVVKLPPGDNRIEEAAETLKKCLGTVNAADVAFLCIGTDRSTGDALGPLVGTALKNQGYLVFGTIDDPVHAMNVEEISQEAKETGRKVIAVDACLGQSASVGHIQIINGPLSPGAGVKKDLGKHGDMSITGIVNVGGFMEYFVLQNTRLSLVMSLAGEIVESIKAAIPLSEMEEIAV